MTNKIIIEQAIEAMEGLSYAAQDASAAVESLSKSFPRSPWEFAKTLPTKARLNYIEECLKDRWSISEMKSEKMQFAGMFLWDLTPQGADYWSNLIPF